ncbi:MAG: hypothetical protein AAGA42_09280 [Actinomycetota bacterium]
MTAYRFLSDDWLTAIAELRLAYTETAADDPNAVTVNYTITAVPFGASTREFHSEYGRTYWAVGHVDAPTVSVNTDYHTMQAIYRDRSPGLDALARAAEAGSVTFAGGGLDAYSAAIRAEYGNPKLAELLDRENEITA